MRAVPDDYAPQRNFELRNANYGIGDMRNFAPQTDSPLGQKLAQFYDILNTPFGAQIHGKKLVGPNENQFL